MKDLVSVSEYAQLYGKDPGNIRRYIQCGRMDGRKIGSQWVLDRNTPYPEDRRQKSGKYRRWRQQSHLKKNRELMEVLSLLSDDLRQIYGSLLQSIILYGSYARGTETEESDIDISLMLKERPAKEMTDKMIRCVASYELELGKVLSVIDIQSEQFELWKHIIPFYMNIEKEGIELWTAA